MPRKKLWLFMVVLLTILLVTSPTFAKTASEKPKPNIFFFLSVTVWAWPSATPPSFLWRINMARAGRKRPGW